MDARGFGENHKRPARRPWLITMKHTKRTKPSRGAHEKTITVPLEPKHRSG